MPLAALLALVFVLTLPLLLGIARLRLRSQQRKDRIRFGKLRDDTGLDRSTGAVHSIQSATITVPAERLDGLWTADHLERLPRPDSLFIEGALLRARARVL